MCHKGCRESSVGWITYRSGRYSAESDQYTFEGVTFPGPKEYDKFLTAMYGDYMQLPPEDQRENRHQIVQIDFGDEPQEEESK